MLDIKETFFYSYLRDNFRVWIQVDGVVISPDPEVPPGLNVRDLHGVADGLDVGAGGSRLGTKESGDSAP